MARFNTKRICPPGVFCITPGILIFSAILVLTLVFVAYQMKYASVAIPQQTEDKQQPFNISISTQSGGDDRYSRPPRPQRFWDNGPEFPVRGALMNPSGQYIFNEPTRGLPESYQSMGVIKTSDGKMLPLYGRRTASSTNRYNYYTRTDTYNPVPLPLHYKRRDCQDDVGCDELMSGDTVKISPTDESGTVTVYKMDGPMYVPGLL